MWETESYKSHEDHMQLFKALEKLMNHDHSDELAQDLVEARKKKKKSRESPKMPLGSPSHQLPPPPPPAGPSRPSELPELPDHPKCYHHHHLHLHLHLHPPVKKVRLKALLHQAHQRLITLSFPSQIDHRKIIKEEKDKNEEELERGIKQNKRCIN
nr:hypothetical protein [Tanacetum cinerariifolium]